MHFYCMIYTCMDMPLHKNPRPEGLQINNFGTPSHDRHNYNLSLADLCLGVEKKIFNGNNAFTVYDLYGHALAQ